MRKFLSLLMSVCIILTSMMFVSPTYSASGRAIAEDGLVEPASVALYFFATANVPVGSSLSLRTATALPTNATVTCVSADTDIATVTNSGIVTGENCGVTTVTATVRVNGTVTEQKEITIYVHLPDGVYTFQNKHSYMYMYSGTTDTEIAEGTQATQRDTSSSLLSRSWRLEYCGNGQYKISAYIQNTKKLKRCDDGNVCMYTIPASTDSEYSKFLWNIVYVSGSNAYSIRPVNKTPSDGDTMSLSYNATQNGLGIRITIDRAEAFQLWNIDGVTNPASGISVFNKISWMQIDTSIRFKCSVYMPESTSQAVTWISSNPSVASVNATGKVTALSEGTTTITVRSNVNSSLVAIQTIQVAPLVDGTYYFMNHYSKKYMDISSTDGSIHQWQFFDLDTQRWVINYHNAGYYTIKSESTGKYLTVLGDSAAANTSVILAERDIISTGQLWRINRTSSDHFVIAAKCGESNELRLTIASNSDSNGVAIKHMSNTNNTRDEWSLSILVASNSAAYVEQDDPMWCWVACAKIFALNYSPNVTASQSEAINAIEQEGGEGGTLNETLDIVDYFLENGNCVMDVTVTEDTQIYSQDTIRRFIDDGHVIILLRTNAHRNLDGTVSYSTGLFSSGGHMTVLYGYTYSDTGYKYLIRNPYRYGDDEYNTSDYMWSYDKICSGFAAADWEISDNQAWQYAIIAETTYSNQTVQNMYVS